jgi:hypothetical protein
MNIKSVFLNVLDEKVSIEQLLVYTKSKKSTMCSN